MSTRTYSLCSGVGMLWWEAGGETPTVGRWVPGIKLSSSGLAAITFTHKAILLT